ncbi:MAG TPA: TolC family protein [Candidatus Desulfovibrio intestinipullorum]|uniref:TolC family protein n=1 Tax=Candidatus Desulfovibrio intestinipullorum TaxID=2838536 RepID=A0A9D1PXE4_9BACT|nr:TolC family protein [Candidatus Desulfovibrio intestinipullorum]
MRCLPLLLLALTLILPPAPVHAAQSRVPNPAIPPAPAPGSTLSVEDTVYGVLRYHRTLRGMQENREVLEHELDRARRGFGPRVDVNASGGWGVLSDSTTRSRDKDGGFYPTVNLSATLTQPIWDGFATRSRVRQAKSTLESQKHRVMDNVSSLCLDGIISHINLLRCRTLVSLAEENVRVHERILGLAKDRVSVGADTQADFTQAQSRYQRALSSLEEQKDALRVAEDTYTRLTGLPATDKLKAVPMPPVVFKSPATVFEQAEQYNPTLAAYMEDIRAARAARELTESSFYPNFNLTAGPNYYDRGDYDESWTWSFDVLLTMSWNIFNSGADVAAYKADSARIRQARQVYYNYIDDLKLDIDSTYSNYLAAQQQYKHYSKAIDYNKYTLNAYNEQFQIGRRTLLDVLDSENELFNSSTQAETSRGNIIIGAYRLLALTGRLLPAMSIATDGINATPPADPEDNREVFEAGWFN